MTQKTPAEAFRAGIEAAARRLIELMPEPDGAPDGTWTAADSREQSRLLDLAADIREIPTPEDFAPMTDAEKLAAASALDAAYAEAEAFDAARRPPDLEDQDQDQEPADEMAELRRAALSNGRP